MSTKKALTNTILQMVVLCIVGVIINFIGIGITKVTGIHLFFDSIGTVVTSVMGGYLPGIMVGLITNLVKGLAFTPTSIYYIVVNVLIAVISYLFSRNGWIKQPMGILALIFILTVIGGGHGFILNWVVEERMNTEEIRTVLPYEVLYDLIDKTVTVLFVVILQTVIPEKIQDIIRVEGWQQKPLTKEEEKIVKESNNRLVSLRTKILFLLVMACIAVGVAATLTSVVLYRSYTTNEHIKLAQGVTALVKSSIDPEKVDTYIEEGDDAPGYKDVEDRLYNIRNSSPDIEYIYVYKIEEDGCHVVFDLDTEELQGGNPGDVIEFDESFSPLIPTLLSGGSIDPIISDDTYGWLITVYEPVYDKDGKCVCYAAADVSMNLIKQNQIVFTIKLMSVFLGFFIFVIALGIWISEYNLILPVNTMAKSASAFAYDSEESLEENVEKIKSLDIRTGDEVENMYLAFSKTTEKSVEYMESIKTKTETIEKMQSALIMVLADMVENRDENTGDHVRKTAAYTRIIMDKLLEMGIYTDQLTEQFIFNVENSAPLHDIGKIQVSDTILNKPGKLTDEEFEKMKFHTVAGAMIIDQVIEKVPDSGYMKEAKNLAEFHHEKWNGKGYPHGLSGEDIPLSARIMAVADVFDALVSERCYKKAFPFEKAMDIIKEDAGTHFDPNVAEAFIASADRVRGVMDQFNEKN